MDDRFNDEYEGEEDDWNDDYWDDDEDDWDNDDWKGENLEVYEDINELMNSIGPCTLRYWEGLFRSFLARNTLNQEAYDVSDEIQVAKQKNNVFIYINNQLLDLCVLALLRKICEKQGRYMTVSHFHSSHDYYMEEVEELFRLGVDIQTTKSFRLLCCELKRWVESGYTTKLRNPKLAPAILNQLKNNI